LAGAILTKPCVSPKVFQGVSLRSKPATNPQTGLSTDPGPASLCDPWREQIEAGLERGLSIQRIYQDLVSEHGFSGSYQSVKRFVRPLREPCPTPRPLRKNY